MKEFSKAMQAYEAGLEHDPQNKELQDGKNNIIIITKQTKTLQFIFVWFSGISRVQQSLQAQDSKLTDEERAQNAMRDPEVAQILGDPAMRVILDQISQEPKALNDHLKNPVVRTKIQKLIDSGILRVRGAM